VQTLSEGSSSTLLIAIPTYDGEDRVLSLLRRLEVLGYLASKSIRVVVIENPSVHSRLHESISSYQVQYVLNETQIGLHGSWIKALEIGMDFDWMLVLGDDDMLLNKAISTLSILSSDVLSQVKLLFARDSSLIPRSLRSFCDNSIQSREFLLNSDIHYGFGFLSNTFMRPSSEMLSIARAVSQNLSNTDCLHYIVLTTYALTSQCNIFLSSRLSIETSIFNDQCAMRASPDSRDTYDKTLGLSSVPYKNLVIWLNTFDEINRLVERGILDLRNYHMVCQSQIQRSFRLWIRSSRLKGLLCLAKCMLLSLRKPIYARILYYYFGVLR